MFVGGGFETLQHGGRGLETWQVREAHNLAGRRLSSLIGLNRSKKAGGGAVRRTQGTTGIKTLLLGATTEMLGASPLSCSYFTLLPWS